MSSQYGGCSIRVTGLKEALRALKEIDSDIPREMKRGIREDARPILDEAKGHASGLGGSGDYAASLSMRTISDGVRIQSSDPGAGTIEFARRGAFYLSGSRRGLPVGVPSGAPPRALVKASEDNRDRVAESVARRIDDVISRYLNG